MQFIFIPPAPIHLMKKENPPPQLHENPQQGADGKPQTETKVKFYKEDKNTLNCALLFNIVFTLCILLYRIVFVLV